MRHLTIVHRYELEDEVYDALVETMRRVGSASVLVEFMAEHPAESISWGGGGTEPETGAIRPLDR